MAMVRLPAESLRTDQNNSHVSWSKDPGRPTILAADNSFNGIGSVLLQIQDDGNSRPISYALRSLSDAAKRYAIIEKEAEVWACEKFSQ